MYSANSLEGVCLIVLFSMGFCLGVIGGLWQRGGGVKKLTATALLFGTVAAGYFVTVLWGLSGLFVTILGVVLLAVGSYLGFVKPEGS